MQPVLSSPKAHWLAQQLGTPSSQPWKADSQERQLVTTTLGQGRSLFGELLNTATENLANERNSSLFLLPKPVRAGWPALMPAQCQLLPTPWLSTALCHLHSTLSMTGCRALRHRWSAGGSCWVPQNTGSCRAPAPRSHRDTLLVTCTPKIEQVC